MLVDKFICTASRIGYMANQVGQLFVARGDEPLPVLFNGECASMGWFAKPSDI